MKKILKLMMWVMLMGLPVVMTSCDGLVTAISDNPISPGLKVTTPSIQVEKGKTFKCNAKASSRTNLVYASADPSIATVDSYGVITGVAEGKTTITITTEGKDSQAKSIFTIESVTIPVEVIKLDVPVKSVKLDKTTLTATLGDDPVKLVATVNPDNADFKTVEWTTSDETVVEVEDGVVTFVGAGTATITATATNGTTDAADDKTAKCEVTVKCLVDKITLNQATLDKPLGTAPVTLTATLSPTEPDDKTVVWKSSNTDVATVDDNGKVTFVGLGNATITATATNGTEETIDDKSATCAVTVAGILYSVKSWSGSAVTSTPTTVTEYTKVTSAMTGDWAAGTYVVTEDVNMTGDISLTGDVDLILCDGKKLTITGHIEGNNHAFAIFGQSDDASTRGIMSVNSNGSSSMKHFATLDFHGGDITAEAGGNVNSGVEVMGSFNVYGGKLTAIHNTIGNYQGPGIGNDRDSYIFGGDVIATGYGLGGILLAELGYIKKTLTVKGGTLLANDISGAQAIYATLAVGDGVTLQDSDNGTDWTDITGTSSTKKYVRTKP